MLLLFPIKHWVAKARGMQERGERFLHRLFAERFIFDAEIFKGKRVLIVGAADFVQEESMSLYGADFDIIVKFNGSFDTPLLFKDGTTKRCDVLFTNLLVKPRIKRLRHQGLNSLVLRVPRSEDFHIFYNYWLLNILHRKILKLVHSTTWAEIEGQLGGFVPTSGFLALLLAIRSPAESVHMIGFSFFNTEWISGHSPWSIDSYEMPKEHSPRRESEFIRRYFLRDEQIVKKHQATVTLGASSTKWLFEEASK